MIELRQTSTFKKWLDSLSDRRAQERIAQRLLRIQSGLLGDVKPVGNGVSEARIDHGPVYRLYFVRRGDTLIVLLCGGDKGSQNRDIAKAHALANDPENES